MPTAKKEKDESKESKTKLCGEMKVKEAINALLLLHKKFIENDLKKQSLLGDVNESPIYLQLMLRRIPPPQMLRMIRVPLPHSLITETSEVCLITGDLDKRNHKAEIEPTVLHYKDLLKKHEVTRVTQVISLRQLRTEYKTFESRRQLAAAYDVFLVDKKIAGVLAKTLGKSFFQTRKFPIQIDMRRLNLKDQIDKALHQTEFSLTCRGNSYALEVARLSMESNAILENIMASLEVLGDKLPGKENNILSLYLKTAKSKAIPIYVSLDIPDNIVIKKPRRKETLGHGELSTMDDAEVKVFRDGRVVLKKTKKESSNDEEDENLGLIEPVFDDVSSENEEDALKTLSNEVSLKKKKKKNKKTANAIEMTDNTELENEDVTLDSTTNKISSKKGKKSTGVDEAMPHACMKNEENIQEGDKSSPKKKKKAKKSICIDQVDANSQDNNEGIGDINIAEVFSKKKKVKKSVGCVSDDTEMKADVQNSSCKESSKKKKNMNSSLAETDEALEDDQNSSKLLSSKTPKISEEDGNLKKKRKSKVYRTEVAEEDINVKTPKSKEGKNKAKGVIDSAEKGISLISIKDGEKMHNVNTPSRSRRAKKENTEILMSSVSKRKKANVDNDVKNNLNSSKRQKKLK